MNIQAEQREEKKRGWVCTTLLESLEYPDCNFFKHVFFKMTCQLNFFLEKVTVVLSKLVLPGFINLSFLTGSGTHFIAFAEIIERKKESLWDNERPSLC